MHILVSSNFGNYEESLKFLDASLQVFLSFPPESRDTLSNLPEGINRIEFEVDGGSYLKVQYIWSSIRATYRLSFVVQVRMEVVRGEGAAMDN